MITDSEIDAAYHTRNARLDRMREEREAAACDTCPDCGDELTDKPCECQGKGKGETR